MWIGEFAKRAGVRPSKIRFYESQGLFPETARSANGYRIYDEADLRIVNFVSRARNLGFSLSDVARFMRRPAQERREKVGVVAALEKKLAESNKHLAEVRLQRRQILALLAELRSTTR